MMSMKVSNVYKVYDVYKAQRTQPMGRISRAEEKKDMVALSTQAKDFQSVMQALSNVPDVRMDKVKEIKTKIDNNQYFVSSEEIANKILGNL
jgi:negative regulator of flagellin synthesis FlgM